MRIRAATRHDEPFVTDLAAEVFSVFGQYRPLLARWFNLPGVLTYVCEVDEKPAGYVMVAFFHEGSQLVGDVLAIAVVPERQGQGLGRLLLQHAIEVCEEAAEHSPVRALRLSVAETNARARSLFSSLGFVELAGDFGHYEGGQRALHMERPMSRSPEGT